MAGLLCARERGDMVMVETRPGQSQKAGVKIGFDSRHSGKL